jgi:hypothetical protein
VVGVLPTIFGHLSGLFMFITVVLCFPSGACGSQATQPQGLLSAGADYAAGPLLALLEKSSPPASGIRCIVGW